MKANIAECMQKVCSSKYMRDIKQTRKTIRAERTRSVLRALMADMY